MLEVARLRGIKKNEKQNTIYPYSKIKNKMNQNANISGYLDKHKVAPFRSGNVYNMFDGRKLDLLVLDSIELTSEKDCQELIEFLQVHRLCFDRPTK